jgi:hypothetical protein
MKKKPARAGQRRKARRQANSDWASTLDALHDHCRNIEALAGLIETCDLELTRPEVVQIAGGLIGEEVSQLRELMQAVESKEVRPAKGARP